MSTKDWIDFGDDIPEHPFILIYGARRIGKSHLCHYLCSFIQDRYDQDHVHLFSKTATIQDVFPFVKEDNRHEGFQVHLLEDMLRVQKALIEQEKNLTKTAPLPTPLAPPLFIICDDVVSDSDVQHSQVIYELAMMGRHLRVGVVLLSHCVGGGAGVRNHVRGNTDLVFTSQMNDADDLDRLSKFYFGAEGRKKGVEKLREITSKQHQFAVAEVHHQGKLALTDYVYKVMAPEELPEITFGDMIRNLGSPSETAKKEGKKRKQVVKGKVNPHAEDGPAGHYGRQESKWQKRRKSAANIGREAPLVHSGYINVIPTGALY